MSNFDSGVKEYINAKATVYVKFPVDWHDKRDICCRHCPYLSTNERLCQLNKAPVAYPSKYVGDDCPLVQCEEGENKND